MQGGLCEERRRETTALGKSNEAGDVRKKPVLIREIQEKCPPRGQSKTGVEKRNVKRGRGACFNERGSDREVVRGEGDREVIERT